MVLTEPKERWIQSFLFFGFSHWFPCDLWLFPFHNFASASAIFGFSKQPVPWPIFLSLVLLTDWRDINAVEVPRGVTMLGWSMWWAWLSDKRCNCKQRLSRLCYPYCHPKPHIDAENDNWCWSGNNDADIGSSWGLSLSFSESVQGGYKNSSGSQSSVADQAVPGSTAWIITVI